MQFSTVIKALAVASVAAAAPAGTLEGVVDTVAPITAGLGVTLNDLLGFKRSTGGVLSKRDISVVEKNVRPVAPIVEEFGPVFDGVRPLPPIIGNAGPHINNGIGF